VKWQGKAGGNTSSSGRWFWKWPRAKGFAALLEKDAPPTVPKTAAFFLS